MIELASDEWTDERVEQLRQRHKLPPNTSTEEVLRVSVSCALSDVAHGAKFSSVKKSTF